MSVQSEIARLTSAKADIISAITEKGVTVPSGAKLPDLGALIAAIEAGGGGGGGVKIATGTVTFADDTTKTTATFDLSSVFTTRDERVDVFIVYNERESSANYDTNKGIWCLVDVVSTYEPYKYDQVSFKKISDIYTFGYGDSAKIYYAPHIKTAHTSKNITMSGWNVSGGLSAVFLAGQTYRYYAIGFGD